MKAFTVVIGGLAEKSDSRETTPHEPASAPELTKGRAAMAVLNKRVRDLFDAACEVGDLGAASDTLAMLEIWCERSAGGLPHGPRHTEQLHLPRMRAELTRRYLMAGVRPETFARAMN